MSIPTIERRFPHIWWLALLAPPMVASAWSDRALDGALVRIETTDAFVATYLNEDSQTPACLTCTGPA